MFDPASDNVFIMLWRLAWPLHLDRAGTLGENRRIHLERHDARIAERTRDLLGRVVALRESRELEVTDASGSRFRGWLWPLDSPEVAVCMLGKRIPTKLALLTQRERECLELLARGVETRLIAKQLDISVSTVHTHMKRPCEKLDLTSIEALDQLRPRGDCYPAFQVDRPRPSEPRQISTNHRLPVRSR